MNKKFLLSVSLISFYSASVPSLFATDSVSLESSPVDLLESNFKTLEDIKESVKSELIEVLLGKLLELQKHDKKKKKNHEHARTRDTSSTIMSSEGSTQRVIEIASPRSAPQMVEMDKSASAATPDAEKSIRHINEEAPESRSTQLPASREQFSPESMPSTPHAMPTMHSPAVSSTETKDASASTVDFSGFSIKKDPLGNFVSINDKILLTQKGLAQLKKQILTQKKTVQKLKMHVKMLEREFISHSISEEEFLLAQIELYKAEKLLTHMNVSRLEQERFLDEHKDLVALLEKFPAHHSGSNQLNPASSGIAQDFFKLFENATPKGGLVSSIAWKEQKEIQTAFQRHFDLHIKMDSSTILAIHKMHKKLQEENSAQTLAATTYTAGTLLLSDMLDSFKGNTEIQQKIAKILPNPKKYGSKAALIADYGKRLNDYPTIFGDEPITMITRHFEHVEDTNSKQAEQAHAFMSKLLDVSLRFSRGLDGLGAFFNPQAQTLDEDKFFTSIAAPLAGIAGIFGIKGAKDTLKEGFTGLVVTDLPSSESLEIIKKTIVKSIVGANKAEMLLNIENFLTAGVVDGPNVLASIREEFKPITDTPDDLSDALLLMMEDMSDTGGFLIPIYTALEEINPLVAMAHGRLDGRRSAGTKLMKILQENHVQSLEQSGTPEQSLEQKIMIAVNGLIKAEFNNLSVISRAKSTAVSALVKELFLHGLFEGIALSDQERKSIATHVEEIISFQTLATHLSTKEIQEREAALNTPAIKAIAQKVALLVKSDNFSTPEFDLQGTLQKKPVMGSAKNTKKEIEACQNELDHALGEEIQALPHLGLRFSELSEKETRALIERCVGRVPALAQSKSAPLEDIVDLIIARVKATKDILIKSGDAKKQLIKANIILADDWKNTITLLGNNERDQLQALGALQPDQMLKLYNHLVDLGEEAVKFNDAIKSKLTQMITLANDGKVHDTLPCTFEDFESAALVDQAQGKLIVVVHGEHIETDLQPFDIKLASTLAWKNRDALIKAKGDSRSNKDLLRTDDNNETLIQTQTLLAHLTNEARVVLGLAPTDGPHEVEQKIKLALKSQDDAINLQANQETDDLQRKKTAVLGAKDLTPPIGDLNEPFKSTAQTSLASRMQMEEQFYDAVSMLDDVLKSKDLHLSDQAIKGLLLLFSHNNDITKETDIKKCGKTISIALMKNFYAVFGADNPQDALENVKNTLIPHRDAVNPKLRKAMNTYCVHIYNVAKRLFAEGIVKDKAFKAVHILEIAEKRELVYALKDLLPRALGQSTSKIEQTLTEMLNTTSYGHQKRKEIIKQAKRILIARTLANAPKLPREEILHMAVNEAIQQTVDAPDRLVVQRTKKKQTVVDETLFDFDHIVRRSSATLQKLMFTKILGMDERSIAFQNQLSCFSSLEEVSATSLLSGLVSLVDDLTGDVFGTTRVTKSARHNTKVALIKRFAKIEKQLLADSIVHDALKKDTIALRMDFRNTLSSRLGSQDSKIQQKALANMGDQALQSLYNALVSDPEDQVAFVDSQLIAHRILRIITAAHAGKHTNAIDYTFHDFMDYIMRATDDESVDIALSDKKGVVTKEALLDLDRLVVGKLSWEKKQQEQDKQKKSDIKKLQEIKKESASEELKEQLMRKASNKESKDTGE